MLRREPYRLFFLLGIALAWAGVSHWFLHGLGLVENYRSVFHAITQIQGFMTCFAVGFLFTMIPRRTGSHPPSMIELAIGIAGPIAITIFAWFEQWALSQVAWLILAVTLVRFVIVRFRAKTANRRPPNAFVWIPIAFLFGIGGSICTAIAGILGQSHWWLHSLGTRLVLQGMFIGLVLGVGSLAIPLMTRGEAPPDGATTREDRLRRAVHVALALFLLATFFVEMSYSLAAAMALRGAVILAVLLNSASLWKRPTQPGWNRWAIWLAAWCLPLGYALAAIFHMQHKAGLHVAFIGGFALLALTVGAHVILGHGDFRAELSGRPAPVMVIGVLMLAAIGFRALMDFDPSRFFVWMVLASAAFLAATVAWMWFLVPKLLKIRSPGGP